MLSLGPGIAYSRLLRLAPGAATQTAGPALECDACESWEHATPTTYVFHLRPAMRWHDVAPVNGRALTAEDVAYSLERLRTPGWPGAALLQSLSSVAARDALTVEVTLRYPDADLPLALAHGQSKLVAKEAVDLRGDLKSGPTIGTGPWVAESVGQGGSTYRAYTAYVEHGFPGLDRLEIVAVSDAATRLTMVATGRADIAVLDDAAWEMLLQSQLRVPLQRAAFPQPGTGMLLGLKTDRPPFDRVEVRQALFQAIDPWKALETPGWEGKGEVGTGMPLPSPDWGLSRQEMQGYFDDAARAKGLLAGAGVQEPVAFTLSLADFGDKHLALGDAYAAMMRGAGFQPSVERLNPRLYAEQVWSRREFQAFLGPMPPVSTPNGFLLGMAHSQGQYAVTGHADADVDRLIMEQFGAETGRGERLRQVQQRMLEQAFLFMPASGASLWVWSDRVKDFAPDFAASEYFHWARVRVGE
ncbi:MAG: ABC transporter substrate-binding protein [Chloroflexi bacterium]|nr:ABC transporter substrate-binding protein [Chloroflexota bacterium]